MKGKVVSGFMPLYIFLQVFMIALFSFGLCISLRLGINMAQPVWLLWMITVVTGSMMAYGFYHLYEARLDYFSYYILDEQGIRARCRNEEWFNASWDELSTCCSYWTSQGKYGYMMFVFAREKDFTLTAKRNTRNNIFGRRVYNRDLSGRAIVLSVVDDEQNSQLTKIIYKYSTVPFRVKGILPKR